MVRVLWADRDLNYVRVRLRKAWTPRVGQTVEVLVVSNPLFFGYNTTFHTKWPPQEYFSQCI